MIEISNLYKSFGEKSVLSGIDLKINQGERLCIIGKSGCGKSVLIKLITGLLKPDAGNIIFDGIDIGNANNDTLFNIRKRIGYVFQNSALFDSYDVFTNVVLPLYEHGEKDWKKLEHRAKEVLSGVGLLPPYEEVETASYQKEWDILSKVKPADLSGGMKKRVGVARALVGKPEYIFYDEPTTGLDPITSEQIDKLIIDIDKNLDVTSIIITHDLYTVYHLAENVVMLEDGKIIFSGSTDELKKSEKLYVQKFVERFS